MVLQLYAFKSIFLVLFERFGLQNKSGIIVAGTKADLYEALKSFFTLAEVMMPPDETYTLKLHLLLSEYYGGPYPIDQFLVQLAPRCVDILVNCTWQEQPINCFQYFRDRITYYGICCVFNFVRPLNSQYM